MSTKQSPSAKKSTTKKPATKPAKPAAKAPAKKAPAKAKPAKRGQEPTAAAAPEAHDAPHVASTEEPAAIAPAAPQEVTDANTDAPEAAPPAPEVGACDRCGRTDVLLRAEGGLTLHNRPDGVACEPAAAREPRFAIDPLIDRVRTLDPAAQRLLLEGLDKASLRAVVERVTGAKTSGRLSPASAVERVVAALAPPPVVAQEPVAEGEAEPGHAAEPASSPADNEGSAPAPTATREAVARDLPPLGTVIVKSDRTGAERARCTIVEGGVDYAGKVYKSISAAAIAAAHDLGLGAKQLNGWAWWGLAKPAGRTHTKQPADVIGAAWDRYRERVEAALRFGGRSEMADLHTLLNAQLSSLLVLTAKAAEGAVQEPSA